MKTMIQTPKRMRRQALLAAALILLAAPTIVRAQTETMSSMTSNGGDGRDLVSGNPASGEMYSTIGEPVALDSTNVGVADEATWTGFWQITPIGPIAAVYTPGVTAGNNGIVATLPDPFAAQVEIRVTLQATSHVRLMVYDLLGKPVGTLLDEPREPGLHRVAWRPENIPAGAYMLVMNVNGDPASARLIRYAP